MITAEIRASVSVSGSSPIAMSLRCEKLVLRPESINKVLHGEDEALGKDIALGTEVRISAVIVGFYMPI